MLITHCSDKNLHKCVIGFTTLFACFFVAKIFLGDKSIILSRLFILRKENSNVPTYNNTKLIKLKPQVITKIPIKSQDSFFKYDVHTMNCKIRHFDPNDKSISNFINYTMEPLICSNITALTTIRNGILTFNYDVLNLYYSKVNMEFCNYQVILRNYSTTNPDEDTELSDKILFKNDTLIKDDFILVKCYNDSGKHVFYSNTHNNGAIDAESYRKYRHQHPTRFGPNNYSVFSTNATSNKTNQSKINMIPIVNNETVKSFQHFPIDNRILNLLMIGIDSTSKLNFIRGLSNTRQYLLSQRNESYTFNGYIKVGDNTFPNLVALLTGKFVKEYPKDFGEHYFDNYSFVWKAFEKSKINYTTAFIEDCFEMATFNYFKKGFYNPPTDFYYRPYSLESNNLLENKDKCIRDKHEVLALLEYSRDLMISFKSWPYFCLTYTARLTHEELNGIKYVDEMLVNYFKDLFKANALENTLIIIFGDHGMRFGKFRETFMGTL
ncbi:unnamed protein product [Gordionus sp. m RMFG-2023]|uniref:uncharacterized protein LOC135928582 n=1 Tax=Gordionus sp. m RMFG-2023 TaxID=3053472 RepID=UPI0030E05480